MKVTYWKPRRRCFLGSDESFEWYPYRNYKYVDRENFAWFQVHINGKLAWHRFLKDIPPTLPSFFLPLTHCAECGNLMPEDYEFCFECSHWTSGYIYQDAILDIKKKRMNRRHQSFKPLSKSR